MPPKTVGQLANALLVFADVVDSSKYSAVLGFQEYADRLLRYQETFKELGRRYFRDVEDKALARSFVDARGDEGIVFFVASQSNQAELVLRAVEFLYHLKGVLRFGAESGDGEPRAPRRLGIGAGIHIGLVACTLDIEDTHSVIAGLEGFAINYAKRVESCSREGRHSRILLSSDAARVLQFEPVILSSIRAGMKGIDDDVQLYEVQSGLFDRLELRSNDPADEHMIRNVCDLADAPGRIDEPWVKAFTVSLLERLCTLTHIQEEKARYRDLQHKLAWHSTNEDDPILLFLRSRQYRDHGAHTQEIRYLKHIVDNHPGFVHARLAMIKACWALAKSKAERSELVYARDMAQEFLEHFSGFLTGSEKREFSRFISGKPRR